MMHSVQCFINNGPVIRFLIPVDIYAGLDQVARFLIHCLEGIRNLLETFILIVQKLAGMHTVVGDHVQETLDPVVHLAPYDGRYCGAKRSRCGAERSALTEYNLRYNNY